MRKLLPLFGVRDFGQLGGLCLNGRLAQSGDSENRAIHPLDSIPKTPGGQRSYQRSFSGAGPFLLASAKPPQLSAIFFANCACVRVMPGPGLGGTVSEASATPPTPLQGLWRFS